MTTARDTVVGQLSRDEQCEMVDLVRGIVRLAPLLVPSLGGMTVRITNAGPWGWWSAPSGYVYVDRHPVTKRRWPPIPALWVDIFHRYATGNRAPDCAHIVWYKLGAKLGRHRDKTERDPTGTVVTPGVGSPAEWTMWDKWGKSSTTTLVTGDVTKLEGPTRDLEHRIAPMRRPDPRSTQHDMFSNEPLPEPLWSPLDSPGRLAVSIRSGAGGRA